MKIAAILGVAGIAAAASAQSVTINIEASNYTPAAGEDVTVTVSAEFSGAAAFAGYWFDLVATGGDGTASNHQFLNGVGALSPAPTANGAGYDSVQTANFPPALGGNASNPLALFSYTLTYNGGVIELTTATNPNSAAPAAQVYVNSGDFAATPVATDVNGATIGVPTPASAALLGLGGLAAARRRR